MRRLSGKGAAVFIQVKFQGQLGNTNRMPLIVTSFPLFQPINCLLTALRVLSSGDSPTVPPCYPRRSR